MTVKSPRSPYPRRFAVVSAAAAAVLTLPVCAAGTGPEPAPTPLYGRAPQLHGRTVRRDRTSREEPEPSRDVHTAAGTVRP